MNANDDMVVGTKGRSNGKDMGSPGINAYVQEHINMVKSIRGEVPYINQGKHDGGEHADLHHGARVGLFRPGDHLGQAMASKLDLQPKAFDYKMKMEGDKLPVPGKYKFA